MIVVSDASPLNYLVLIGHADVLSELELEADMVCSNYVWQVSGV